MLTFQQLTHLVAEKEIYREGDRTEIFKSYEGRNGGRGLRLWTPTIFTDLRDGHGRRNRCIGIIVLENNYWREGV